MRKSVFAVLAALLLCLSACREAPVQESDNFDELIVVGFSQVGAESDWRAANTKSMQEAFTEANGYRLIFDDAQQKQERQINAIRSFIQQDVDYIVLAPTTELGWDTVLKEAQNAGIPVIIIDRMIEVEDESLFTCWIGSDFRREGDRAVEWLEERFGEEPVNIIHLQGNIGSSAQIGRTNGLDEGLSRNSNWNLVARDSGEFTQAKAQELMRHYIDLDFNVIYAENDNMAYGAIDVLKEEGLTPGQEVIVVSFDASRRGLVLTLAGDISFNVECNPLHGPRVSAIISRLEAGETPTKFTYVPEMTFSSETITQNIIDLRAY
ncbi:MAG: ABC transporter substrate-binding protein [Oscillospiraceae bacterium]|jgi:simple sugar transport system substrate-binding protein|nr:ABC transporter substrate-binding protein [Oscillospiraceae bacterium]